MRTYRPENVEAVMAGATVLAALGNMRLEQIKILEDVGLTFP